MARRILQPPQIDDTTAKGRFILAVVDAVVELERDLIAGRSRPPLHAAGTPGKAGRPPVLTASQIQDAVRRRSRGESIARIAADYGVTRAAIYKRIKEGGK